MENEVFVDGLGDIRLHAGMARVDFFVSDADPAQPAAQRRAARLVMTPQALLQVAQGLVKAVGHLQLANQARTAPATAVATTETPPSPAKLAPPEPGRSPNFAAR